MNTSVKPRLVIFQCQFNHYSEADIKSLEALETARVKLVQVPCAGRISPLFILNAVQGGVDGIIISGCVPGKCHFKEGNLGARRQLDAFRELLIYLGLEPQRLRFAWLDPADRGRLVEEAEKLISAVCLLGPATRLVTRTSSASKAA